MRRAPGASWEVAALLLRDYLWAHPEELADYGDLKRGLAAKFPHDGVAYTEAKMPYCWEAIRRVDDWAQRIG